MSKDLNRCEFIGRLGRDTESRFMPNGNQIVTFSLACGDDYKDKNGQKVEQTEWVNMVCYGKTAEIAEKYLKKGSKIFAEGRFKTSKWDKDDVTQYKTEIVLNSFQMLDSAPSDNSAQSKHHEQKSNGYSPQDNFEDVPF
jgi:single-strand DNA-binding protein